MLSIEQSVCLFVVNERGDTAALAVAPANPSGPILTHSANTFLAT